MAFVPQVPRVGGGSGCQVNAFIQRVKPFLVVPLLVVHLFRRAATTMKRNPQASAPFGFVAKGFEIKRHFQRAFFDHFVFDF